MESPNGLVTTLGYDPEGRTIETRRSAEGVVLTTATTAYTLTGKPAMAVDPNGGITRYEYDALDRLIGHTDAAGRLTRYAYDALGRRTRVFNSAIQAAPLLQQGHTANGLVASLTDANGNATNFAYDGFDRLGTTTYPLGSTEAFTYDAAGNVLTRKTRANGTIAFTYDALNRLATKTPPSPAPVVSYRYDLAGRLTGTSDTSATITPAVPPAPNTKYTTTYSYDARNRPTLVTFDPAPAAAAPGDTSVTFTHGYNRANQRVTQAVTDNAWVEYPAATPSTASYTANALSQYTAVGAVTPTYDGNGNLTSDGTFTYGYDAENRLTSASGPGVTASYAPDAQGRRKSKTVNGATTLFVTDADNREVLEYDGASGAVQRWYAYGLGPNDVLNQMNVSANTRTTFIPDIQGSIIATLDSATGALSKTGYLPYGDSTSTAGTFRYTGQRIDAESGLYYYRARAYKPTWGRFVQVDPIGYSGGVNLYAYVGNDPLNLIDPRGLEAAGRLPSGALAGGSVALPGFGTGGISGVGGAIGYGAAAATGGLAAAALLATTTSTADRSRDEMSYTFYHGTTVPSGLALLNGAPLSPTAIAQNTLNPGGDPAFYLATDPNDARYFGSLHITPSNPGTTILQYSVTAGALHTLQSQGSTIGPIPQAGARGSFSG